MFKISFYVPSSHVDVVKNALFKAGAGTIGNYQCCAWQVLGEGQFMPKKGSNPFIGEQDHLETMEEYKVEMVCDDAYIQDAITALKKAHPYEEPAYFITRIENK